MRVPDSNPFLDARFPHSNPFTDARFFSGFLMKLLNLWGMMRVRLEALVVVLIGNLS